MTVNDNRAAVDLDSDCEGGYRIARVGDLQRERRTVRVGVKKHAVRWPHND